MQRIAPNAVHLHVHPVAEVIVAHTQEKKSTSTRSKVSPMPLYLVPVWSSTKTYPVYVVLLVSGAVDSFCERPRRRPLHRPSPCARCSPRRAALVPPRHLPSNSCSTALEPSTVRLVSVEPYSVWCSVAPRRCAAVRGVASWLPHPIHTVHRRAVCSSAQLVAAEVYSRPACRRQCATGPSSPSPSRR